MKLITSLAVMCYVLLFGMGCNTKAPDNAAKQGTESAVQQSPATDQGSPETETEDTAGEEAGSDEEESSEETEE